MKQTRLVFSILSLLALLVLSGCSGDTNAAPDITAPEASTETTEILEEDLPPVELASLERGRIEAVLRFSTNLEAESEVQVFSQAARRVTELLVEEGDRVREGQVLVRLENEEQKSALAKIESQLRQAQREYERQKRLYERELISEQAWNEATYEVELLELQQEDAKRDLGYTEVRAPISGTITTRHVNLGDTITVNQLLFDMVDFNTIVARIYVPEGELSRLNLGQQARLFSNSLDTARTGEVDRIAPVVDPRSGTVKVTVGIPGNQGLLPGMYVEVELVTEVLEEALLVPKRAVIYSDTQAFLYRYNDETRKVERVTLEARLEDRQNLVPSSDVLAAGDQLVVAGQAGLKDGVKVRTVAAVPSTAEGTGGMP